MQKKEIPEGRFYITSGIIINTCVIMRFCFHAGPEKKLDFLKNLLFFEKPQVDYSGIRIFS